MQSVHNDHLHHATTTETFEQTPKTTTQHGISHRDHSDMPLSDGGEGAEPPGSSSAGFGEVETTRVIDSRRDVNESAGLSLTHFTPPRNKITEYENALVASPPKPNQGPLFEVVKKRRGPNDKRSPISELPNGIDSASCSTKFLANTLLSRGPDSYDIASVTQ